MLDGASAQGENEEVLSGQAGNSRVFAVAERGFTVASEEFGNSCGRFGLDYVIYIEKAPAQAAGKQRTDSALP
jgi:NADH dehydrogenase/NADH:ubiquinone oxidoreductase subunit G